MCVVSRLVVGVSGMLGIWSVVWLVGLWVLLVLLSVLVPVLCWKKMLVANLFVTVLLERLRLGDDFVSAQKRERGCLFWNFADFAQIGVE